MNRIKCLDCKNWTLTKPAFRIGWCKVLETQTEWCAGTLFQTKTRVKFCSHFLKGESKTAEYEKNKTETPLDRCQVSKGLRIREGRNWRVVSKKELRALINKLLIKSWGE